MKIMIKDMFLFGIMENALAMGTTIGVVGLNRPFSGCNDSDNHIYAISAHTDSILLFI
jgi:hypothetical protein